MITPKHRTIERRVGRHKKRARKHGLSAVFAPTDWKNCLRWWQSSCAYCGQPGTMTIDHYIPLRAGKKSKGTTVENIIPCCYPCNQDKRGNLPDDWLPTRFGPDRAAVIEQRIRVYFAQAETVSGHDLRPAPNTLQ